MPRCFSISIQSDVAWRDALRAFTEPAIWIAPENSSSFSVSVVLPASGCEMMAKVRRRRISAAKGEADKGGLRNAAAMLLRPCAGPRRCTSMRRHRSSRTTLSSRRPRGGGHEPGQGAVPEARSRKLDLVQLLPGRRRGRAARRAAAGRSCSCATRTASTGSSSSRSARPERGRLDRDGRAALSVGPHAPRRSCRATRRTLVWMVNLGCIELHPHPVRAEDLDHPDELRVDLDPVPGVEWPQIAQVAAVVRDVLDDHGLVGWPKTSGSRGIHVNVRIERRWTFDQVRRAALALAREVERRAPDAGDQQVVEGGAPRRLPRLQPERQGPHRRLGVVGAARRRTRACRCRWRGTRSPTCDPGDFTLATVPARFAAIGDRHAGIDERAGSLDALLELSAAAGGGGQGDAPWPPHYTKQAGEPPRVAPSRAKASGRAPTPRPLSPQPLITSPARAQGGRARRPRALEGAPPGGARRALQPDDVLRRLDARPHFDELDAHPRRTCEHVPESERPPRSRRIPTTIPGRRRRRAADCTRRGAEDPLQLVGRRDLELVVAAVPRRLVGAPAQEGRGVAEAVALHVVVRDLAHALEAAAAPSSDPCPVPAALRRRAAASASSLGAASAQSRQGCSSSASSRSGASSIDELLALGLRERRGDADVVQRAVVVVEAEQERADHRRRGRSCASGSRRPRSRRCARA